MICSSLPTAGNRSVERGAPGQKPAQDALGGGGGDDAAVVDATVRKRYSDDPRLRIEVREFTS